MVWHPAQLRTNSEFPSARLPADTSTCGIPAGYAGAAGASELTNATICSVWVRSKRGGFWTGWAVATASGMRPVDTQKSTVAGPRPWRFGARSVPDGVDAVAARAVQLEQRLARRDVGARWQVVGDGGRCPRRSWPTSSAALGGGVAACEATGRPT